MGTNILEIADGGDVNASGDEPEWLEFEVAVDTAAVARVPNKFDIPGYELRESEGSGNKQPFLAANNHPIKNEGGAEIMLLADLGDGRTKEI